MAPKIRDTPEKQRTSRPVTARQQAIIDLVTADPTLKVSQIASRLKMSPGSVYQQLSRLRSAGRLPTFDRPAPRLRNATPRAASNGAGRTVEQHLKEELEVTEERLRVLAEEQDRLTTRRDRLDVAAKTLLAA